MRPTWRRKLCLSDVAFGEWSLAVPSSTLMTKAAPQRDRILRTLFDALRCGIAKKDDYVAGFERGREALLDLG